MTRNFPRFFRSGPILILIFALGLLLIFWPPRPLRSDNFVLYMPNATHVLPVTIVQNKKYLSLLQVLNQLGKVVGLQEKKNSLKVWFGNSEMEFRLNENAFRINKTLVTLQDPVRVQNGQWMVPVDFLSSPLSRLIHQTIEFPTGTNRIFIGDVKPTSFTLSLDHLPNGSRVTVQFTDKVSVRTVASNGKWVMFLGDHAVEPLEQSYHFQDLYVSDLQFEDQDGVPKLILTPAIGGLNFYPVLAEGGKVLLADLVKPPAQVAEQAPPPEPPKTTAPPSEVPTPPVPSVEEEPAAPPGPPLPVVVLDAGHGGNDSGARGRDGVLEKDLAAQLVSRVRLALLSTKKYRTVLTRVGDSNPTFEQRELAANVARPLAFLTFHAGNLGTGTPRVIVYSYQPPTPPAAAGQGQPLQLFIPWTQVQQAHLEQSRQLALALQQQFTQIPGMPADKPWQAPERTLRSVNAPAVAIEIGSLSPEADSAPLASPDFQQAISAAIARALEALHKGES